MLYNLLADRAIAIGKFCADLADHHKAKQEAWIERGRYWSDVARWLRLRCVKSFADVRAERKQAKP